MGGIVAFLIITNVLVVGFAIWALSSLNEKLELLIRIQLKRENVHFNDRVLDEEIEKYRDTV